MQIKTITVEYAELRSTGYPDFSNKKYGLTVSADVQDGETPRQVREAIEKNVIEQVKMFFGDQIKDRPF